MHFFCSSSSLPLIILSDHFVSAHSAEAQGTRHSGLFCFPEALNISLSVLTLGHSFELSALSIPLAHSVPHARLTQIKHELAGGF